MAYSKTTWVQEETPLNAANMNHIEDGIETADANASSALASATAATAKIADVTKTEIDLLSGKTSDNLHKITAGTTDLTAGTSALATGEIYLVYETD